MKTIIKLEEVLKDDRIIISHNEIYYPIGEQETPYGSFTLYNGVNFPTTVSKASIYNKKISLKELSSYEIREL